MAFNYTFPLTVGIWSIYPCNDENPALPSRRRGRHGLFLEADITPSCRCNAGNRPGWELYTLLPCAAIHDRNENERVTFPLSPNRSDCHGRHDIGQPRITRCLICNYARQSAYTPQILRCSSERFRRIY